MNDLDNVLFSAIDYKEQKKEKCDSGKKCDDVKKQRLVNRRAQILKNEQKLNQIRRSANCRLEFQEEKDKENSSDGGETTSFVPTPIPKIHSPIRGGKEEVPSTTAFVSKDTFASREQKVEDFFHKRFENQL